MNDLSPAGPGHNNPPDPIDVACAPFDGLFSEVENWTDGTPVENDAQMGDVDRLIKEMKSAKTEVGKARDAETKPLHAAWKAEVARWKPTEEGIQRRIDCLVAVVAPYKAEALRKQDEARKAAFAAARKAEDEAREAARKAADGDLESQAEADRHRAEFEAAQKAAQATKNDAVKGTRKVTRFEITGMSDVLRWMNQDVAGREALEACASEFVRKNHKTTIIHGVRTWEEREAF